MDELLEILEDINPDIDYENEDNLIDGKMLNSLEIITLMGEICDTFDIEISAKYLDNRYFNSVEAMWNMIQEIREEE